MRLEAGVESEAVGSTEASNAPNSLARTSPRTRYCCPQTLREHAEQTVSHRDVHALREKLYRVEGDWDEIDLFIISYVRRRVSAAENVLVVATGKRGGEEVSGHGHFHRLEVAPANEAAVNLFGGRQPRFVPEYLLTSFRP